MQANLIYNPNSGMLNGTGPDEMVALLREAGFDPLYTATSSEEDLAGILAKAEGLVVIAGGDGSVRAVVTRLLGKKLPIAIIPMGTANNIAKAFHIEGTPEEIIAGLRDPIQKSFDVGSVNSPWGKDYFLEAFGAGLYAEALHIYKPEKGKSLGRTLSTAFQLLSEYEPQVFNLWVDGFDYSGEYLLVEVLNTEAFGPRIKAVPGADTSDGSFEVVLVHPDQRAGIMKYLLAWVNDEIETLPSVQVVQGRELLMQWTGFPVHVDAEVRPRSKTADSAQIPANGVRAPGLAQPNSSIVASMLHRAVNVWIPRYVEPVKEKEEAKNNQKNER